MNLPLKIKLKKTKEGKLDIAGTLKGFTMREFSYIATVFGVGALIFTVLFLRDSLSFQPLLIVALIFAITPLIAYNYMQYKRVKEIEMYLPDFLRDVAESNKSGLTISKSIESATTGHYGALSEEMKVVSAQISWGISFEDTLARFAKRINSGLVKQTMLIIIESYKSGGDIADVLEAVSDDVRVLKRIESERKSELQVYTISTYFIFFLFLAIIIVLSKSFLPATPQLNAVASIIGGNVISQVSEDEFKTYFFHLCLIQAFFAGLMSGQMGEGSLTAGFKHSFILIVVTLVAFQVFLGAEPFANKLAAEISRMPPNIAGMSSTEMPYTLMSTTTAAEVADAVKAIVKEKKLSGYEEFGAENVIFMESGCGPCMRGDIVVERAMITVKKPAKVMFRVNARQGKYDVMIGGS
jgi:flagellar protein FlaJ